MKLAQTAGKVLDLCIGVLLFAMLLLPPLYLRATVLESFRVPQELMLTAGGWIFIALVSLRRSLNGQPIWSSGQGSWFRRTMMMLVGWLLITSALGHASASPWQYAFTAVTFVLVGQSILDWLEDRLERRRILYIGLGILVGYQVLIAWAEWQKLPFQEWSKAVPTFAAEDGTIPFGWWLHDLTAIVGLLAKNGEAAGTFGNVNYFAEFMVLTLPVFIGVAIGLKSRLKQVAMAVAIFVGLTVTIAAGTRAALFGLVMGGLIVTLFNFGLTGVNIRKWWAEPKGRLALGALAAALVIVFSVAGNTMYNKITLTKGPETSLSSRLVNWRSGIGVWNDHRLAGTGLGGYKVLNVAELKEQHPEGLPKVATTARFLQAHNEPLQALTELGLVGFALLVLALGFWLREVRSNPDLPMGVRVGLQWGVISLLGASLFGFPFHIPVTSFVFIILLATGMARARTTEPSILPVIWRPIYAVAAVVLIAGVGLQVVQKGAWPLFLAHEYAFAGQHLRNADRFREAEVVYTLAARHDRFKGDLHYYRLNMMSNQDRHGDVLKAYDQAMAEGMSTEGLYWKARALDATGKTIEAVKAYNEIITFFGKDSPGAQRAARRLAELANELLAKKDQGGIKLIINSATVTP